MLFNILFLSVFSYNLIRGIPLGVNNYKDVGDIYQDNSSIHHLIDENNVNDEFHSSIKSSVHNLDRETKFHYLYNCILDDTAENTDYDSLNTKLLFQKLNLFIKSAKKCRDSTPLPTTSDEKEGLRQRFLGLHLLNKKLQSVPEIPLGVRLDTSFPSEEDEDLQNFEFQARSGRHGQHCKPRNPAIGIFNFLTFLVYAFSVLVSLLLLATGALTNTLNGSFLSTILNILVNNNNNNNNNNDNMSNNNNNNNNRKRSVGDNSWWTAVLKNSLGVGEDGEFQETDKNSNSDDNSNHRHYNNNNNNKYDNYNYTKAISEQCYYNSKSSIAEDLYKFLGIVKSYLGPEITDFELSKNIEQLQTNMESGFMMSLLSLTSGQHTMINGICFPALHGWMHDYLHSITNNYIQQ